MFNRGQNGYNRLLADHTYLNKDTEEEFVSEILQQICVQGHVSGNGRLMIFLETHIPICHKDMLTVCVCVPNGKISENKFQMKYLTMGLFFFFRSKLTLYQETESN